MSARLATVGVLTLIALRNLLASRLKTLIIGGIIFFGSVLVVVGSSLLDSIERSMARSIQGSVAGHIQVYSSTSKDELSLFGNMGGDPDLNEIDDFSKIKQTLEQVPNVREVVPMGISGAMVASGNTIDQTLEKLRDRVNRQRAGDDSPALRAEIDSLKQHVRQMATVLKEDRKNVEKLSAARAAAEEERQGIEQATSDAFWMSFDDDPLNALEFLENRVAPLASDADLLFVRYIGTDLEAFAKSFDRMEIVDGQAVPPGQRGFLFGKYFYEERVKLKTARRLDKIKEAMEEKDKTIAGDDELKRWVKENVDQVKELVLQLDPIKTKLAIERLQQHLGAQETTLAPLLARFFQMDDSNFKQRYAWFYEQLAPLVELYRIRIGDTFTIKAFTRTGFMQAVNVKVYGTYQFKGLEKSPISGSLCLMDLVSFRELYGYLTAEKAQEIEQIKAQSGARTVDRATAEADLFGGGATIEAEAVPGVINELERFEGGSRALRAEDLAKRIYSQAEIDKGVALNAALILEDPDKLDETLTAVNETAQKAGLELKAVSWQKASGLIGQFVILLRAVLYVAVLIIFVVALVIMNNAMMMATLQRVREIGTMRAIGAQRSFILQMLLIETAVTGLVFGALGGLAGTGLVRWLQQRGIPAMNEQLYFFFSGPRLYPELSSSNVVVAFVIVLLVSGLSSFYPAWLATRVSPLQAMQTDD